MRNSEMHDFKDTVLAFRKQRLICVPTMSQSDQVIEGGSHWGDRRDNLACSHRIGPV
ncbi:MAG TPA: hypothetical protein VH744_08715 [Terriglobales bacterium]